MRSNGPQEINKDPHITYVCISKPWTNVRLFDTMSTILARRILLRLHRLSPFTLTIGNQCHRFHNSSSTFATEVPTQPPQTKLAETLGQSEISKIEHCTGGYKSISFRSATNWSHSSALAHRAVWSCREGPFAAYGGIKIWPLGTFQVGLFCSQKMAYCAWWHSEPQRHEDTKRRNSSTTISEHFESKGLTRKCLRR